MRWRRSCSRLKACAACSTTLRTSRRPRLSGSNPMNNPRWLAYAILRVTLGGVFLFYGVGKFVVGLAATAQWFQDGFAKTWLPPASVYAFSLALPFFEVTIGVLLILGLFTRYAAAVAGLLIMALTIGLT